MPSFCSLDRDPGLCMGYFTKYFHNSTSGKCESFAYGGCLGNENNFETKEECEGNCTGILNNTLTHVE